MNHDDSTPVNALGEPIGQPLLDWSPPPVPQREVIEGRWCQLEPADPERHAAELYEAFREDTEGRVWTYSFSGPFDTLASYRAWMESKCMGSDPMFFAVREHESQRALGLLSYLRLNPQMGVIEIGHISYSPRLQNTTAATEAMFLMMRRAFELGYRRLEWKCDALNTGSVRAALRLGFQSEGTFRQAVIYKGRNRDTHWFSIIDQEWPPLRRRFEAWLDPSNFDASGQQRTALREIELTQSAAGQCGLG